MRYSNTLTTSIVTVELIGDLKDGEGDKAFAIDELQEGPDLLRFIAEEHVALLSAFLADYQSAQFTATSILVSGRSTRELPCRLNLTLSVCIHVACDEASLQERANKAVSLLSTNIASMVTGHVSRRETRSGATASILGRTAMKGAGMNLGDIQALRGLRSPRS